MWIGSEIWRSNFSFWLGAVAAPGRNALTRAGLVLGLTLGSVALATPALAHGGDETQEGYLLVQQALGHLAHDTSKDGVDLALEKVDDALGAKDQDGVDVAEVSKAKTELEAMRVVQARALLQDSIKVALADLPPAVGNETGTTLVVPELPGRTGLGALDWVFLIGSLAIGASGLWLAYLFRPQDSMAVLRRRLGGTSAGLGEPGLTPLEGDGGQ